MVRNVAAVVSSLIIAGSLFASGVGALAPRTAGEEFPTYRTGSDIHVCDKAKIELIAGVVEDNQQPVEACIVTGKDVDLAYPYGRQVNRGMPFIRLHGTASGKFSKLNGLRSPPQIIAGTNTMFYAGTTGLVVVDDITEVLSIDQSNDDGVDAYSIDSGVYNKKILTGNGVVGSFRVSKDGVFITAYADDTGVIKYNIHTSEVLALALIDGHSKSTQNKPRIEAVSGDGRFIFVGPEGEIIDTYGCGDTLAGRLSGLTLAHPCHQRYIGNITESVGGIGSRTSGGIFSDDSQELRFSVQSEKNNKVTMYQVSTAVPGVKQITYLALGDSFASGEGNINKTGPGYRWGTDVNGSKTTPKEKCHLSELSYPFLLANDMGYGEYAIDSTMNWSSVACSGARIRDISGVNSASYGGQDNDGRPRLEGFNNRTRLKEVAFEEMTPGRQKQIELVRRYQPKSVTISIGGNDAQFGDTLAACVQPVGKGAEWTSTCSYAKDDGKKANIAYTIFTLRNKLMDVYQELLDAGPPGMKLYVIGYPIFVDKNPSNAACGMSVRLNNNEREMIVESTKFLNMMARSAADEAGAIFISTEDSFGANVLCGSSNKKAVNGIVLNDTSASFHPNPYGHELMAKRIQDALGDANLDTYSCHDSYYVTCPGGSADQVYTPEYFKKAIANNSRALNDSDIVGGFLRTLVNIPVAAGSYIYGANSPVSIIWYSEPQELGTFTTAADGSLNVEVSLPPDTPSGYHTLEIHGTGVDGQPLTLWKIVQVENPSNPLTENISPGEQGYGSNKNDKLVANSSGVTGKSKSFSMTDTNASGNNPTSNNNLDATGSKNMATLSPVDAREVSARSMDRDRTITVIVIAAGSVVAIITTRAILRKYKGKKV